MALSGKWALAGAGGLALMLFGACGTGASMEGQGTSLREVTTTAGVSSQPDAGNDASVRLGPVITSSGAIELEALFAGQIREPIATAGDRVVVKSLPANVSPEEQGFSYDLWNPETGEARHLWESEAGEQYLVTGGDGPWVAVVRTGLELPLADWKLELRNVETGEWREVARSRAEVAAVEGLAVGPPTGLAPSVAMSATHAAWAEFIPLGEGKIAKAIRVHDIAADMTATVFSVPDARVGDAWATALGSTKLAFAARESREAAPTVHVRDLTTGDEQQVDDVGEPFAVALTGDGTHVAWDDRMHAKRAQDLETGERVTFAGSLGWGVQASGGFISWTPASGRGGAAGYYDTATRTLFVREERTDSFANTGQVMGKWYVWQERPATAMNPGSYYFRALR